VASQLKIKDQISKIKDTDEKNIKISLKADGEFQVIFTITDNGVGIDNEDLTRVFSYGFSTKQLGHGFGLHSSANNAQELGGNLEVYSPGRNQGATFLLRIPSQISRDKLQNHIG